MKKIKGNIVEVAKAGTFNIIVHGCNCFCTMNSGVAKDLRIEFPGIYEEDCTTKKGDKNKLGSFSYYNTGKIIIVNAYTQYRYGTSQMQLSYIALADVFKNINGTFPAYMTIAYPKIGAGLAGGNWDLIEPIIDKELEGRDHTLILL